MATRLPVVELKGKRYFRDDRIKEIRHVTNPHDSIKFDDMDIHDLRELFKEEIHGQGKTMKARTMLDKAVKMVKG
jgi:hypothetical protein